MGSFLLLGMASAVGLLMFLPLVLQTDVFFDFQSNKIGCNVSLYGIFKILGGYLSPCTNGIAFHVSQKKALLLNFKQMSEEQKGFSKKHGLRLKKIRVAIELNADTFFPFLVLTEIGKLVLLFRKASLKFFYRNYVAETENIRIFARLTFSTIIIKEIFLNVKHIVLKGGNALWQRKKSAI